MAADIQWYIRSTKDMSQAELGTLFIPDENKSQGYMGYYSMQLRLRNFCRRYMRDESYPIHLGDTRHLAMINLIMRGANPMTIKDFAGHTNATTSAHYYSNISNTISNGAVRTNTLKIGTRLILINTNQSIFIKSDSR